MCYDIKIKILLRSAGEVKRMRFEKISITVGKNIYNEYKTMMYKNQGCRERLLSVIYHFIVFS